jgi:outer membrane protein TolC
MMVRPLLCVITFALTGLSVHGQTPQPPDRAQQAAAPLPCSAEDGCPVLTLEDFLRQVLQNSPSARANQLAEERAAARVLAARGRFEPAFGTSYEYKTQGGKDKLNVLRSGVKWPLNLPTSPTLKFDYRRGLGSSIDPSVVTSPVGETRFGLSFSPLGGFRTTKSRAALDKARLEPRRADALQDRKRNRLLLKATRAFWDWVKARRTLGVRRDLLQLAERREALITRKAQAGEAPAVDSIEAARITASRRGAVAKAVQTAQEKRIKLTTFLWNDDGSPASFQYAPPDIGMPPPIDTTEASDALSTALERRPTLRSIEVKQQQTRIEQRLARERLRPNLKLKAQAVSYTESPLNITDVKVGFEIEQPLFFRTRRSDVEKAQIQRRELDFKQDRAERAVQADVRSALSALSQAHRRARAAKRNERLARKLLEAEQRRFEQGEATLFRLNQREKNLADAQKQRISVKVTALKAYAAYRWATGTIGDPYTGSLSSDEEADTSQD